MGVAGPIGKGGGRICRSLLTAGKADDALRSSSKIRLKPQLCSYLGVPDASARGEIPLIISKFLKLYQHQSPGIKKDRVWEENLKAILHGKERIGLSEVNKILSPQFNDPSLKNMEMDKQKENSSKKEKGGKRKKVK